MPETTRLDRFVIWIKNNKVLAVIILMGISVMAISQFVQSVVNLVRAGREFVSSGHTEDAESGFLRALAPSKPAATITFSGKGTGPGLFTDARNIAVDQRGQVFVVEWNRGRVQRFEADGKFIGQWSITPWEDDTVNGISIDTNGVLYVAHQKDVWRYDGDTGKLLGKLTFPKDDLFQVWDVKVIPGGGVAINWEGFDYHVVLFDAALRVRRTLTNPLYSHREGLADPHPEPGKLAVDGLGNIYVAQNHGEVVFKFSSDGAFLNRFGSDGVAPGQLHNIQAIAVNGKGDVFVSDVSGIQVFDGTGRFVRRIEMHDSWAMGIAFNNSGQLYAITDNAVMRFDSP